MGGGGVEAKADLLNRGEFFFKRSMCSAAFAVQAKGEKKRGSTRHRDPLNGLRCSSNRK